MLINSHPVIASKKPRPSCSICCETGHTDRAAMHINKQVGDTSSSDHEIIKSMILLIAFINLHQTIQLCVSFNLR